MSEKERQSERLKSAILEASRADLSSVFRLVYVSRTSPFFGSDDLAEIGRISSLRNSEADITGILVMDDGNILQILEGEKNQVTKLFEKIAKDRRHEDVREVSSGAKAFRYLSCWSIVGGAGTSAPKALMSDFHRLHARLREGVEIEDVTAEEVELLKVIALFRSVPL